MNRVPITRAKTLAGEDIEGYYFYDYKESKHYVMMWARMHDDGLYDWDYSEIDIDTIYVYFEEK